ncbi:unnamed protein product [Trichobilharzia szidati]|nr:unnamed protein product [Trichobilharzia szidati]
MSSGCLTIKIFHLDYYLSPPIDLLDMNYSSFSGRFSSRMPVIRVYGTASTGQKICCNVHGVLPYFYVDLPTYELGGGDFVRSFVFSLEKSIRTKLNNYNMKDMYIFDASVVSGLSIYGYHDTERPFIKLYLVDPAIVTVCSEILQSGAVLNRVFQTYETHIPYLLQFCVDYNLYGMNLLYAGYFKFRTSDYINFPSLLKNSENMWSPSKLNSEHLLQPKCAPKYTSMELEVDISAWDILNRRELGINPSINPGLEAMWTEEEMRRISKFDKSENFPKMPTANELLPCDEQNIEVSLSASESKYLSQWTVLLQQYTISQSQQDDNLTDIESSIPNDDYVSKWLECSFTEDDDETIGEEEEDKEDEEKDIEGYKGNLTIEANDADDAEDETISVQLTQESLVLKTFVENTATTTATIATPRPAPPTTTENKSSASFTTISSTGLQELYRLASATEEYDAWVPNSEQLDQLHNHLECTSKLHALQPPSSSSSVNLTKLEYSQQLLVNTHNNSINAGWTSSPIDLLEVKPSDNVSSEDLLWTSQHAIVQPLQTTTITDANREESHNNNDDDVGDEDTLITNATQCAISFVCNQLDNTHKSIVGAYLTTVHETHGDDNDDEQCMSQPSGFIDVNPEEMFNMPVSQNNNNNKESSSVAYDCWDEMSDDLFLTYLDDSYDADYIPCQELKSINEENEDVDAADGDVDDDDDVFHLHSTPVQDDTGNKQLPLIEGDHNDGDDDVDDGGGGGGCSLSDSLLLLSSPPPPQPLIRLSHDDDEVDDYATKESVQQHRQEEQQQPCLSAVSSGIDKSKSNSSEPLLDMDNISEILFDSWSSESDTSLPSNRVPQVDGNMDSSCTDGDNEKKDTSSNTVDGVKPARKRRRLGLRLPRRESGTSQTGTTQNTENMTLSSPTSRLSTSISASMNLFPVDISTPICGRRRDQCLSDNNNSTIGDFSPSVSVNSTPKPGISVSECLPSTSYSNPVVILERIPSPSTSPLTNTEPLPYQSKKRSTPREEFNDLEETILTCIHTETSQMATMTMIDSVVPTAEEPVFSSFHYDFSDLTYCSPNTSSSSQYPGRLSLYSQTQLSLAVDTSPTATTTANTGNIPDAIDDNQSAELLSPLPSPSPPPPPRRPPVRRPPCAPSFWRPVHSPPRLKVVNDWLEKFKALKEDNKLSTILDNNEEEGDEEEEEEDEEEGGDNSSNNNQSELSAERDKSASLSNELFQQETSDKILNSTHHHHHHPSSVDSIVKTLSSGQNHSQGCSMKNVSADESFSNTRQSTIGSVSLLYQTANDRCYSSIQVDHTTVASLELHCRSRLTKSSTVGAPTATAATTTTNDFTMSTSKYTKPSSNYQSKCGLIPDPNFDPIQVACLSFSHPQQIPTSTATTTTTATATPTETSGKQIRYTNLFVLILLSELSGVNETTVSSFRQLPPKYLHGLTNNGYGRRRRKRNLIPCIIWCTTEWNLISWIVYLIQTFNPEILIGYDVERYSWGYLVDRANHFGRRTITRELSRLASDIINCPHCHQCINECIKLVHTMIGIMTTSGPTTNTTTTTEHCSPKHFDTQEFMNSIQHRCNCPCNPLYSSTMASKYNSHSTATTNSTSSSSSTPTNNPRVVWPCGPGAGRTGGLFPCPGRVVLCFWRILMHEISLYEYSLETVVRELLKEYMPCYTFGQLNEWYSNINGTNRWRTVDYWIHRSIVNLRLLNTLDLIGRTSEFARVFGIEFYHVLSRGSQYRVESLLCRIAKQFNFLLPSPTVTQRAHQRAPEAIPLNLEPESVLFIDGPVAVLDFQSLYPSIIIAYNYCYSTILGHISCLLQGDNSVFNLGCLTHSLPSGLIQKIGQEVNISPSGIVFVKKSIREGILPRMLKQLLTTRLMVKDSIKLYKSDKCLNRLLDARQLGLKLMANVTFGYTAASFSGRMPCVDLGDSIVHKARETLEQAIELVNSGQIALPESCNGLPTPRVVYGDTDSLFIHLKGYGKLEAFEASYRIAEVITSKNPVPIKLKFEKIYYPCLLEAKKRYVGYAYESLNQTEPVFDAKGIETVRKDSCPFVGRILEECFKLLFNHFTIPQCVKNNDDGADDDEFKDSLNAPTGYQSIDKSLKLAEYNLRSKIQQFAYRLIHGRIPFHECIITRPYWGLTAYKAGTFSPALQVARRLLSLDPRSEPLRGERVVYFIAAGRSDQALLSCVRSLHEIHPSIWITGKSSASRRLLAPRLNYGYYLDKQFIPPIERMTQVIGWRVRNWLSDLPRSSAFKHHRYVLNSGPSSASQRRFTNLGSPSSSTFSLSPSSSQMNFTTGLQHKRCRRPSALMRAFVAQIPQICPSCESLVPNTSSTDQLGHCRTCIHGNSKLMNIGVIKLGCAINHIQSQLNRLETICTYCTVNRGILCDTIWLCNNFNCPVNSKRLLASADVAMLWTRYSKCLNSQIDTVNSW